MDATSNMDFDFVASGHYAKVVTDEINELSFLQLSKDMVKICYLFSLPTYTEGYMLEFQVKDQTYFLSYLSQAQLKRLVLPLGCIPKVSKFAL